MARYSNDPIKSDARRAKARRRVGYGGTCTRCGESRAEALVARSRPKLCMQCYAVRRGKKGTEAHHLGGEANSPLKVEISANDHRTLSDVQYDWPPGALENPDGSPLMALSNCLRGIADFIGELIVAFINRLAQAAQDIDTHLRAQYGLWWKGTDFDGWQPQ
jgi:hypothetical protein